MADFRKGKIAEGHEAMKLAAKAMKTTMFKWKPDLDEASQQYDKAGQCFKLGKDHKACISACQEAAKVHTETKDMHHAGRSLESAADAARDLKDYGLCKSLLKQASQLYLRGGIGDAASTALEKSGKELEKQGQYEEAADVFLAVADIYETDDKIRRMRVPLERAVGGFIKAKKLESAMETLKKQAVLFNQVQEQNNIDKNWLSRIIVQLAMGDFVAAEKLYDEAMGSPTGTSEEQYLADQMLDAYDEADQEALNAVTSNQTFAFLQNDVAVLARKLTAEGGTGRAAKKLEAMKVEDLPPVVNLPPPVVEGELAPIAPVMPVIAPAPTPAADTPAEPAADTPAEPAAPTDGAVAQEPAAATAAEDAGEDDEDDEDDLL